MEIYSSRVTFAAAGLWAADTPVFALPGEGANVTCTTDTPHGLTTGNYVVVSGTTGVTGLNATWLVKVVSSTVFELVGSGALTGTPDSTSAAVGLPDMDISGMTGEWTLHGTIYGTGLVSIEDTVDDWSATQPRFFVFGKDGQEGQAFSFTWRDWEGGDRFGVDSALMRVRLVAGTNVTVSVAVDYTVAAT